MPLTLWCFAFIMILKTRAWNQIARPFGRMMHFQSMSVALKERLSSEGQCMHSAMFTNAPAVVESHLKARRCDESILNKIKDIQNLREVRSSLIKTADHARSVRKSLSASIGALVKSDGENASKIQSLKEEVEVQSKEISDCDLQLLDIDARLHQQVISLPNLLDDRFVLLKTFFFLFLCIIILCRVPDGDDETSNVVVRTWKHEERKIGEYMWHDEIGHKMGFIDSDASSRISGARFSVLRGGIARLERAISEYFLDFQTGRGYEEVSVPYIVTRSTLEGTGQLPKFEHDLFMVNHKVGDEDTFLIPTSEVPVTNIYKHQIIPVEELPIRMACLSPCFRAEAGSSGRDTRGLLRQHQFKKVELVKICTPETSNDELEKMVMDVEALIQSLDIPYRTVMLCSGDIGFSASLCYDIEVWMPGQQLYREISSCSNCRDFQSRRMGTRYRVVEHSGGKNKNINMYPHTLNGSGVAVGRFEEY